jgi:oxygen-independent coproporphyrinogen-3 oxidase
LTREHFFAVLQTIRNHFVLAPDVEITCEANPGTTLRRQARRYCACRGQSPEVRVQSFCDVELATLGRIHNADAARQSLRQAREAGFSNIAIDLIFAIPGQSLLQWKRNIAEALAFNPEHLSVYGLTVEAGTPLDAEFKAGRMHPCSEEVAAQDDAGCHAPVASPPDMSNTNCPTMRFPE